MSCLHCETNERQTLSAGGTGLPPRSQKSVCHGLRRLLVGVFWAMVGLTPNFCFTQVPAADSSAANNPDKPLSPAAEVIRASNPTTPTELIKAINHLITFGDLGLAKQYAVALSEKENLDDDRLVNIGDELDPVSLLRIVNHTQLDPRARNLCKKILAAMRARDVDPNRLAALVDAITSENPTDRRSAIVEMRAVGPIAVPPLVELLLSGDGRKNVVAKKALVALGRQAVPPLLAVLQTDNQQLRTDILHVLSEIEDARAIDDVLVATLTPQKVVLQSEAVPPKDVRQNKKTGEHLEATIHDYLLGRKQIAADLEGKSTLWEWNNDQETLTHREVPRSLCSAQAAYRLASALSRATSKREYLLLEGVALLQWEKSNGGLGQPITQKTLKQFEEIAKQYNAGDQIDVLDFAEIVFEKAFDQGYTPAAIAAAEVLAQENLGIDADASLLTRRGAASHPLVEALNQKDRRLRMACCRAILNSTSAHPFVGASDVGRTLSYFASSQGKPRVLVADNRPVRRRKVISLLKEAGYIPDATKSGREAIRAAQRQSDYVAAFIAFNIGSRSIQDILHEFRIDARTAGLPIALMADPQNSTAAQKLADDDPLTLVVFPPQDSSMAQGDMERLVTLAREEFVPAEERLEQAREAIQLFNKLLTRIPDSKNSDPWEQILTESIEVEELAADAVVVLSRLATPMAQHALVEAASDAYLPLSTRQAAAEAFGKSVAAQGVGLSIRQIQQLKNRYDATEGSDPREEAILWSLLEVIQKSSDKHGSN